jgi:diguanylate cyclase (GGDEF)-like protein
VSLVFFDINALKAINDNEGHAAGDAAIQRVASTMGETFRGADIIARLAGDEFVVLLHNTSAEQAPRSIERLRDHRRNADTHQELTLSYGVITYDSQRHPDITHLIAEADDRMYDDKQRHAGRATSDNV